MSSLKNRIIEGFFKNKEVVFFILYSLLWIVENYN